MACAIGGLPRQAYGIRSAARTARDPQSPVDEKKPAAPKAQIALPVNRGINQLLELRPDRIAARRDHLRRLNGDQLFHRVDPEEGIGEPAPAKCPRRSRRQCFGNIDHGRAAKTEAIAFHPRFRKSLVAHLFDRLAARQMVHPHEFDSFRAQQTRAFQAATL